MITSSSPPRRRRHALPGIGFAIRTVVAIAPDLLLAEAAITVAEVLAPLALLAGMRLLLTALSAGDPPWPGLVLVAVGEGIPAFGSRVVYGPVGARLSWRITQTLGPRVAAVLATMPWVRLQDPAAKDRLDLVPDGILAVELIWDSGTALVRDAGRSAAALWFLSTIHWPAAALALAALVPTVALRRRAALEWESVRLSETPERRRAGYLAGLLTGRAAAAEVRLFGYGRYIQRLWGQALRDLWRAESAEQARTGLRALAAEVVTTGLTLAAAVDVLFVGGAARTGSGLLALLTAFQQTQGISYWVGSLTQENRTAGNLVEVLGWGRSLRPWPSGRRLRRRTGGRGALGGGGSATLAPLAAWCGVTFTYPGGSQPAVHDLTLEVQPGERLALVGPNGSGKTTAVRLLLGLLSPAAGSIVRPRRVGVAFQGYGRYALTVAENVGIGRPGAMHARARVQAALDRVEVACAPEQPLGQFLRAGVEPSGGQWQRMALARALYGGAPLLILDEPASGLDPLAESRLYADFVRVAAGRTVVLVAHRLAAARLADRIAVFDGGRLAELGTHASLLAQEGLYARMWAAQSGWVR